MLVSIQVTDFFEFPMSLDLKPFTRRGLAEAEEDSAAAGRKELPEEEQEERELPDEYYRYPVMSKP